MKVSRRAVIITTMSMLVCLTISCSTYLSLKQKFVTSEKTVATSEVTSKVTQEGSRLIFFANEANINFVNFLKSKSIPILHVTHSEFDKYKKQKYIIIEGVPNESNGMGRIVRQILSKEERKWLSEMGNGKMYLKMNLWGKDQFVIVFAGYDREAADRARINSKDKWWTYISSWFDIELSHEELYGY